MIRQVRNGRWDVRRHAGGGRAARTLLIALLASVAVVPAARGGTEWQQYGNGVGHANYADARLDPASLKLAWSAPAGFYRPLVGGGAVYGMTYPSSSGGPCTVASFDPATGRVNWSATGSLSNPSALAYADGLLCYFASDANDSQTSRLWVRDAATGAVKYSVSYTRDSSLTATCTPLLARDAAGHLIAYFASRNNVHAVLLGQTAGTKLWDSASPRGLDIVTGQPSIVGNALFFSETGEYFAYDLTFGILGAVHKGNVSGGGNGTPVVDAARNRIYVNADYGAPGAIDHVITAYQYNGGTSFTLLWQHTGTGVDQDGGMALDAAGNIYSTDYRGNLVVLAPDGSVLRTLTGQDIGTALAPTITDRAMYLAAGKQVRAYDPVTFDLLASFNDDRGRNDTTTLKYLGPVTDDMMIVDHIAGTGGFNVYRPVPEPGAAGMLAAAAMLATALRRRRRVWGPTPG